MIYQYNNYIYIYIYINYNYNNKKYISYNYKRPTKTLDFTNLFGKNVTTFSTLFLHNNSPRINILPEENVSPSRS